MPEIGERFLDGDNSVLYFHSFLSSSNFARLFPAAFDAYLSPSISGDVSVLRKTSANYIKHALIQKKYLSKSS